jgi:integrase
VPVYRKGRDRWRVRIWSKGLRQDWIVPGTKADAERFEARKRLEVSAGIEPRGVPTLSVFIRTEYEPHASARLKESTRRNRVYQLATIEAHLGALRLDEVRAPAVEAYQTARLDEQIKPATVNDEVKVLKAILSHARERYGLRPLKVAKLRVPKKRNVRAWSEAEVQRLLEAAIRIEPELVPILVFLVNTGCRKGEAIALRWDAVDVKRRVIRIWPNEEWRPKDDEPREVPLSDSLLAWLRAPRRGDLVYLNRSGRPWASWPQRRFDEARKAAGLVGGPHTLRHTYSTHFLRACPDLFLLGRILGHTHARVTELYAHLLPDQMERARQAVSIAPVQGPAAVAMAARRLRSELARANRLQRRG